jgi:ribonuclease HI
MLRACRTTLLSPEEVLARYSAGPKSGVFTDGSCEGNPGPGGWGVVWVEDDAVRAERSGRDPATTNNRMELAALIAAYELLPADAAVDDVLRQPDLREDGERVGRGLGAARLAAQERRDREPRAGADAVGARQGAPDVRLRWIRAHDGSKWNEYADALSNAFMRGR